MRVLQVWRLLQQALNLPEVSLGTTRLRVLQDCRLLEPRSNRPGFIRYDPLEGTASGSVASDKAYRVGGFIRYDPIEGTASGTGIAFMQYIVKFH